MEFIQVLTLPRAITNYEQTVEWVINKAVSNDQVYSVEAANTHVVALAKTDERFGAAMSKFDLIVPDGMPLVWAINAELPKSKRLSDRVYGPTLMLETFKSKNAEAKHFLLGGKQSTLDSLKSKFQKDFPHASIVGMYSPPFGDWPEEELDKICQLIKKSGANLIWIGLGCPKQEQWIAENKEKLPKGVYFGVGAAFAFHAGEIKQAPSIFQKLGLEWLYRLCMEPKRLWKRYFTYNSLFLFHYLRNQF